jgi:hypothetical protein
MQGWNHFGMHFRKDNTMQISLN